MVHAVICFEKNEKVSCLRHVENITFRLRHLLRGFYENLTESRVSRSVWLSYVQGFQGWGVGRMVDGEFIKYDGLSANQVLFFQALDAFLGMDRYLTDQSMNRYVPVKQRELCIALKKHSFRRTLQAQSDMAIEHEVAKIVNHLRVRTGLSLFFCTQIWKKTRLLTHIHPRCSALLTGLARCHIWNNPRQSA